MRKLNLLLALILIACYSGFGSRSVYSSVPSNDATCHSVKKEHDAQNKHKVDAATHYLSKNATGHTPFRCCFESLTNAPQNDHLTIDDAKSGGSFIINSSLKTETGLISSLSIGIREHDPPDLYVSNSSLLL